MLFFQSKDNDERPGRIGPKIVVFDASTGKLLFILFIEISFKTLVLLHTCPGGVRITFINVASPKF